MSKSPLNLVVLISGSGSNLQSIINAIEAGKLNATIKAVISNKADVKGLDRARKYNIPTKVLSHKDYETRDAFDSELQNTIDRFNPDLVILAGFMRILGQDISRHYRGKMLNIHPSLLPKYPGLHTHDRVLEAGDKEHGTSIHFVTEELDGGPLVYQRSFIIDTDDTPDSLFKKVQALEHQMYPEVIQWIADGRMVFKEEPFFDGQRLGPSGVIISNI